MASLYVHAADDGGILLIDGGDGRSAWVTAADLCRRLDQAAGADVLLSSGTSPLAIEVVDLVVASGARVTRSEDVHPDARRPDGLTSLMAAAYVGALGLVADLVERGAPLDATDASGYTASMYAAQAGELESLRLVLAAGADANVADHDGSTAIMFAAANGDLKAAKVLLGHGAEAGVHRFDGLDAITIAERNGHEKVATVLGAAARQTPQGG